MISLAEGSTFWNWFHNGKKLFYERGTFMKIEELINEHYQYLSPTEIAIADYITKP